MRLDDARLLRFAEKLQSATDIGELLSTTAAEVRETLGYNTAWIAVFDFDNDTVRMLAAQSAADIDVWGQAPVFPISTDPYMVRIAEASGPQIVRDAQTDPGVNRDIVTALGNRTIVNIPMRLLDQPFGALGTGSFGDEGVKVPSPEQLRYLEGLANQLVIASARIVLLRQREEAAAETARLNHLLERQERLASLGQLAGGVAHDFNNLLTVIMASAGHLMLNEVDQERRDDLDIILEASERAGELTRRLLTLGKRQPLRLTPTEPATLLQTMVDMLRRVIPASIEIELNVASDLPTLAADRSQLEQVITNLCLNARDAMPDGGTLTIECGLVEASADPADDGDKRSEPHVEIQVRDSGKGMSPDTMERIFEPFYTTKGEGQGTGLGLAVCRGVVEQHQGFIEVSSRVDEGTTFRVGLPLRSVPKTVEDKATGPAALGGTERVLVADDEPFIRRAIGRMLKMHGYHVVTVSDGRSAVDAIRNESFDLVILDAVMPRLGGRQAREEIRAIRPETRFLFATGYGAEELTARFLTDTEVPFVQKPFSMDLLLRAVRDVLDRPDTAGALAASVGKPTS